MTDMSPAPGLAKSWKQENDKTWLFDLVDNAVFHNDEPMTRETWRNNVVNLPRSIIPTPDLDLDVRWSDQAWFMILISWCLRHSYLAGSLSSHR